MNAIHRLKRVLKTVIREPFITLLVFLLIVLLTVFLFVIFSERPQWVYNLLGIAKIEEPKYESLKFLGISMGGILIALQALMSYRRAKALEDTARAQANAVVRTEQGQQQDRLKNAIEHLGHGSESVRLGGAYELFHLAEDNEGLRHTVHDILCAHIRWTTGKDKYRQVHKSKPSEEIQSLLKLLFFLPHRVFEGCYINLQGSWLNGAELDDADLQKADFTQAYLRGVSLSDALLYGATFFKAQMQGAYLVRANLSGSFLYGAQLQGANIGRAQLRGTDLYEAQMQGVNLASAQLQGAILGDAELQGAYLNAAETQGVRCEQDTSNSFAQCMRKSIDKESDLSWVIFSGGLTLDKVNSFVENLSDDDEAMRLREELESHIGKPSSYDLPEDSGVITGAYTEEEAEMWIAEYEEAVSGSWVLGDDNQCPS